MVDRLRPGCRPRLCCPDSAGYWVMVIVPFIPEWIVQWNGYVPATEKTRLALPPPPAMLPDIVQEPSSSPTLCGAESEFVQVITSPTLALTGPHWKPPTAASTVVGSVESAQTWEVAVVAPGDAAVDAAGPCVAGPWVGAELGPPEQAARARAVPSVAIPRAMGRMRVLQGRVRRSRHDSATCRRSSYGSSVAGDRIFDSDLARRLVLHEARAQQTPARELRDLGDGWLLHDPSDAEPFWNRLIAPRWPSDTAAFDRRLDEVITLFATLARLPHVRPLPVGCEPPDIVARLLAAGFVSMGADRRMLLLQPERVAALRAAAEARVVAAFGSRAVAISRQDLSSSPAGDRRWGERRRWADDAALVLAEAFGVEAIRRMALEHDVLACVSRPGCAMLLLRVDGEPAAIARRATNEEGSYLSSIGTRPAFRRRGLGALATLVALEDALAHGGSTIHLAVEADNEAGRRLYQGLGFALVGEPAPDLLLR